MSAVTRLEAGRRQLHTAIELWFAEGDDVSIHTLAGAAHQIFHDLNRKRKGPPLLYDSESVADENRKEFIAIVKRPMNFFKHADGRKGEAVEEIEFDPRSSEIFMLGSIQAIVSFGLQIAPIERFFVYWCEIHRPKWIDVAAQERLREAFDSEHLRDLAQLSRPVLLKIFMNGTV